MDGFPGAILIGGEEPQRADGFWNADGTWRALWKPTERASEEPPPAAAQDVDDKVEVCRSFAYKLNLANHGGPQYESADFFCSRKMSCRSESAEMLSQELFEQCVMEIQGSVRAFIETMQSKRAAAVQRATEERAALSRAVTRPTAHPTRQGNR